ncbi:ABC transporter permease subunit [Thiomicrospira microaerophila]|uniref:ABC transporter permease subunit n=1 Tax=Thiomicrospira microaerophila TaxID=406020 RepID=UPI0005C9E752|nr:ABC transporter permease subunit [Thiomicrospira microaerophila]
MSEQTKQGLHDTLNGPKTKKRLAIRRFKDHAAKYGISVGGVSIIFAVFLIMFFLMYVVLPIFTPATIEKRVEMQVPGGMDTKTLHYALDDHREAGVRITDTGRIIGFSTENADVMLDKTLPIQNSRITSFTLINEAENEFAFGFADGRVLIGKISFRISYPNNQRLVLPVIEWPYGEEGKQIINEPIEQLAVRERETAMMIVVQAAGSNVLHVQTFRKRSSFLSDEVQLDLDERTQFTTESHVDHMLLGGLMRDLVLVSHDGQAYYYSLANMSQPELLQKVRVILPGETLTSVRFLNGNTSMMFGTDTGRVVQWFPVRDKNNDFALQEIRSFQRDSHPVISMGMEATRKGFAVGDAQGGFHLYYSTSHRHLRSVDVANEPLSFVRFAPRSNGAIVETASGRLISYDIDNPHPEVSFGSLWNKVWYEGYSEPTHTWQSSSGNDDFEFKFSLTPLTFGTIKAALYSMLFAVPIAIFAAIYTAFFMDKRTRQWVKPSVELIEALPTVILGFLAGLWLAPYVESNLPAFFAIIIVVPLGILLFGYGWSRMPDKIRLMIPVGRRVVLMIPVVAFLGWLSMAMSDPLQYMFFQGDMRTWLTETAGITYDQRNAMIIGFAMGFALIPTIFSVAEDAIYSVPNYLVNGSYALGASGWQTLKGVVLPTASPGIFSAIMLGFGRGVGETMIVLMASGNTPLMDINLFEGMRTLSANLAVEMGETEVDSTHYRVLFLAGLVLFMFTFFFNTVAEVVRQRMRRKYGQL